MNESSIQETWSSYDQKIDRLISLNERLLVDSLRGKVTNSVNRSKPIKWIGIILGIGWVIFLDSLCFMAYHASWSLFLISVGIISLLTKFAIGTYIYQLVKLYQIDYSKTVSEAQRHIVSIKKSTILAARIMVLQLPFWTTWYLDREFMLHGEIAYLVVNLVIILSFTIVSVWLFSQLHMKNLNKKWVKRLFTDNEWKQLNHASYLLEQMKHFDSDTSLV